MRESEDALSVYQDVEIPPDMQRDLWREQVFDDIDAAPGNDRHAALRVYALISTQFAMAQQSGRDLTPTEVQDIYESFRRDGRRKHGCAAAQFTLTHVLIRGIYDQMWCEREEDFGPRYHTFRQVNTLIDQTIQGMASQKE